MSQMAFTVRRMTEGDLAAVAEIEAGVFTDWNRLYRRDPQALSERTLKDLHYTMSFDPGGNFVAVAPDGAIVGFIFSRIWGRVGWFGTFGVPTQHQGSGIGKALLTESVAYLKENASVVGLETMAESGANLGLYAKAGFCVTYPAVLMSLSLVRDADRLKGLSSEDAHVLRPEEGHAAGRAMAGIRGISEELLPGLDYSREVKAIAKHDLGETLISEGKDGVMDGFAVVRTAPFRDMDVSGRAYLHVLAVRPGADDERVVDDLIRQVWTRTVSRGFTRLVTGVSGSNRRAIELLLGTGFRGVRAAIRMVDRDAPSALFRPSDVVDVSRWAG